jgi:hypothetical protein
MDKIVTLFYKVSGPTVEDAQDAKQLEQAFNRFCNVFEEARQASEQLRKVGQHGDRKAL